MAQRQQDQPPPPPITAGERNHGPHLKDRVGERNRLPRTGGPIAHREDAWRDAVLDRSATEIDTQ
ncbi:MAG TPA: hypothetical protein VFJ14_10720 [Nocardioidaceae bacterium]|nr:hypothetical protein [Nocardioidaceae bacterium]